MHQRSAKFETAPTPPLLQPAAPAPSAAIPDPITADAPLLAGAADDAGLGAQGGSTAGDFPDPQAIFRAAVRIAQRDFRAGSRKPSTVAFSTTRPTSKPAVRAGAVLSMTDARYPPALRDIFDALRCSTRAVAGTAGHADAGWWGTRPPAYGGVAASNFPPIWRRPVTIASGMARGATRRIAGCRSGRR